MSTVTKTKPKTTPKLVQDAPPIVPAEAADTSVPALATGGGGALVLSNNPFSDFGNAAGGGPSHPIIKFVKGDYAIGREQEDVPLGTKMVAVVTELSWGYLRFEDNRPVREFMGRLADRYTPPRVHELPLRDKSQWEVDDRGQPRDPYQPTNELPMVNVETGEVCLFTTQSQGGKSAVGEIAKAYGARMAAHPNELPVIKLDAHKYQHSDRSIGWVKVPKFTIVGWVDGADYLKALEDAEE
jgi:hypothetical protein